jgi:hypothetical protein
MAGCAAGGPGGPGAGRGARGAGRAFGSLLAKGPEKARERAISHARYRSAWEIPPLSAATAACSCAQPARRVSAQSCI